MESPASTQSAVTRCGRFVSYAAITLERLTCSFPNAVGRSAPSASIASSSVSARPPRCHSQSTRTCFAMPVGSSSPTMATTHGPCSTTLGTRTSSTRSGTPKWRPTDSRTFGGTDSGQPHVLGWSGALGAFWTGVIAIVIWLGKRQVGKALRLAPRTRFGHRLRNPFDHLGIGASFPRREHPLDHLDCGLNLLVGHRLDASAVLDLHFPRHQHCADLQVRRRRLAPHPLEHLSPMLLPILSQIEQKALVERSARSFRRAIIFPPPRPPLSACLRGSFLKQSSLEHQGAGVAAGSMRAATCSRFGVVRPCMRPRRRRAPRAWPRPLRGGYTTCTG